MIDEKEILRRRDMRDVLTFTVDPADAKDFDDALSYETLSAPAVYQIGVHIADVSYYVRPGTPVDDEAYKRGTSTYLVDRVIPMLPEELCNDLCSLKPDEDKLCMSVVFQIDENAQVLKYKICRTVIRSDARLNYDEVQQIILSDPTVKCENQTNDTESRENRIETISGQKGALEQAIHTLNTLAHKLRAARIANGALTIEQPEIRFKLDEKGHPTDIFFEKPNDAHHLIEEFMLLANKTVAKAVGSGKPFVYRVHDLPDSDKLEEIKKFKKQYSGRLRKMANVQCPMSNLQNIVDMMTIRAQAKAVYSTYNIGHYGLAFTHYTHFTSPIRRYPDLMVHRLVDKYCLSAKRSFSETVLQRSGLTAQVVAREQLELMCEHCSACEQEATQAERDSVKLFQTIWMADHLGEIFPGHISAITDFGFFVQLDDTHCEGLVRMELIEHPEDFLLGDPVNVQVIRADINRSQIDMEMV